MKPLALILSCAATLPLTACAFDADAPGDLAAEDDLGTATQATLYTFPAAVAYAWASEPSTASYTPAATWSKSPHGITIDRAGTGTYWVRLHEVTNGLGNAQVVAYGPGLARCKVAGWMTDGDQTSIGVRCHMPSGTLVDSPFVVYYADEEWSDGAYLWSSNATASHDAMPAYSFNAAGGVNRIDRTGVGIYRVRLGGILHSSGHPLVTAYGTDASHCKPVGWGPIGFDTFVDVRCWSTTGARADSQFSLRYVDSDIFFDVGYAWLDRPAPTAPYTPNATYRQGTVSAWQPANGLYVDSFEGVSFKGFALTSAYDDNANYCKVKEWQGHDELTQVHVACFSPTGAAVNTRHSTLAGAFAWPECPDLGPDVWIDC